MSASDELGQERNVLRSWDVMPIADHGEGIYLYDTKGKRYLDAAGGSSTIVNIGHGVRSVVDAMYEQAKKVSFSTPHIFANEPVIRLAHKVSSLAPGNLRNHCRTWFVCTGSDAVEDAVRLARQYFVSIKKASKFLVIGRWQSFHGNNLAIAGIHGSVARRKIHFPMYVNNPHISPAYCYRCPFGLTYPECTLKCARELETIINQIGEEYIAAFIAEPVAGSGLGNVPAPEGYFEVIREICDRRDILFISDEVMTAWGRIGHWFGIEHWGVTPDVIATAKGLASGYSPVGATIAREDMWEAIKGTGVPFSAGKTMNQNPVGCAGALATIQYIESHRLLSNAHEVGNYMMGRLRELLSFDIVGDVRGMAMMAGIELVSNKSSKSPFDPHLRASARCQEIALKRGLILYACTGCVEGVAGDMITISPPLIITRSQVDEMIELLKETIEELQSVLPA